MYHIDDPDYIHYVRAFWTYHCAYFLFDVFISPFELAVFVDLNEYLFVDPNPPATSTEGGNSKAEEAAGNG